MVHPRVQLHLGQKLLGQGLPFRLTNTCIDQGQFHILQGIKLRQEKELLEDKADLPISNLGQLLIT